MYTSVADQTTEQLGGPLSVLVRQKRDHVRLSALMERLEGSAGEEQAAVLIDIHRLVFPHAFAEESVLWPVMRRVLPDGEELTLEVEREHQEVNELVTKLEGLEEGSPERADVLDRLTEVLDDDVRDEEDALFPPPRRRHSTGPVRCWPRPRMPSNCCPSCGPARTRPGASSPGNRRSRGEPRCSVPRPPGSSSSLCGSRSAGADSAAAPRPPAGRRGAGWSPAAGRCVLGERRGPPLRDTRPCEERTYPMESRCPSCGSALIELDEDQWPAEGPVPAGTIAVFQCEQNHRVTVGQTQVSA